MHATPPHAPTVLLVLVALTAGGVEGQVRAPCRGDVPSTACRPGGFDRGTDAGRVDADAGSASSPLILASLALPGSGQLLRGNDRGWTYAGLEALAVLAYLERRSSARDLRTRYRELAWDVARLREGTRNEGDFGYYEAVAEWTSSGAWDRNPDRAGLQPETDPSTYNGRIWKLAREIYPGAEGSDRDSEAFRRALAYYRERSYGPGMRWSWVGRSRSHARYRDLIDRSDESFREATVALGLVLGNHILSAVDAYLASALGDRPAPRISVGPVQPPGTPRAWGLRVDLSH